MANLYNFKNRMFNDRVGIFLPAMLALSETPKQLQYLEYAVSRLNVKNVMFPTTFSLF